MRFEYQPSEVSISDLLDAGFRLYRAHFRAYIVIVALLQVPMALLRFLTQRISANYALPQWIVPNDMLVVWPFFGLSPLVQLFPPYPLALGLGLFQYLIIQSSIISALVMMISRDYFHLSTSINSAYRVALCRLPALLPAMTLLWIIRYLLGELCIACISTIKVLTDDIYQRVYVLQIAPSPGNMFLVVLFSGLVLVLALIVWIYAKLFLTPQIVVLEDCSIWNGVSRSWQLTKVPFWYTLMLVIPVELLVYLLTATPAAIVGFVVRILSHPISGYDFAQTQLFVMLAAQLSGVVALPVQLTFTTLLYNALRMHHEGTGLEPMSTAS